MGIKRNHAKFENINSSISIIPYDEECADYLFVNGEKTFQKQEIFHLDRIVFGTGSAFLLKIPGTQPRAYSKVQNELDVDWEFAQEELTQKID